MPINEKQFLQINGFLLFHLSSCLLHDEIVTKTLEESNFATGLCLGTQDDPSKCSPAASQVYKINVQNTGE